MSLDLFMTTISWLGSLYVLLPAAALLSGLLALTGRWRDSVVLWLGLGLTSIIVHLAKLLFRRPRPEAFDLLVAMPADWSFPSAHTAQAAAFFGFIAIIASRELTASLAGPVILGCALIVTGVGWSRVYLQVHYLSDVLAGGLVAVIVLAALQRFLPHLLR